MLDGAGADRERVGTRVGLRHTEGLKTNLTRGDAGEVLLLLRIRAVPQHGAHDVHLRMAGARVAALMVDLLEDDRRVRLAESAAAVFLWDQRAEPAVLGEALDEFGRVRLLAVEFSPVFAGELFAKFGDALTDHRLTFESFLVNHA